MTVEIGLDARSLVVRMTGTDALWALRRRLRVPLDAVAGVYVLSRDAAEEDRPRFRAPGTHWPGRITAGIYHGSGGRQFWCVRRSAEVLVVDLAGALTRVVVEVDDPYGVAGTIAAATG